MEVPSIILHLCTKNHNYMTYGSWVMEWNRQFFCHFRHFFPFYPPSNPENQNSEKTKKASGDVIMLHIRNKNHSHMMCAPWDMECDRHNFLLFWAIFCPFTPLTTWKTKILKKWNIHLEISAFYTCVPHMTTKWYIWLLRYRVQQTECNRPVILGHF